MLEERILEVLLSVMVEEDETMQLNMQNQLKHIIINTPIKTLFIKESI